MADAPEPPPAGADEPADAAPVADAGEALGSPADTGASSGAPRRPGVRGLGWRTIAICAVISLLVALVAAFVFVAIAGDDDTAPDDQLELTPGDGADDGTVPASSVDADRLLGLRVFDVAGEATTLDQLRGDGRTLVNFWQSACVPCVEELPLLQAASVDNPDVAFLGANVQETDEAAAAELLERTGVAYPTFDDPEGNLYAAVGLGGLPATVLLGPDGAVLATELGGFSDAAELQAFLDEHPA